MNGRVDELSGVLVPKLSGWTDRLELIARTPLRYCEGFPRIAERFEAWWAHDCLDRPIFIGAANGNPSRPITRRLELLDEPDQWLAAKQADMLQTHRVGDALPNIRVDFGPVLLASFFGGKREFGSDTAWTHSFIDDEWSNEPDWNIPEGNPWWHSMTRLFDLVAADGAGRYVVCAPDLGGSADVLLNLRGATQLCMDVIDRPDRVRNAIDAMYDAWETTFTSMYDAVVGTHGAGLIHWFGLWSDRPYHSPACDFNYMIGPKEFEDLCLPDVARQSASVGRACFHLDGPMAARHIDSILDVPAIQAIQFTPGASAPSALAWVDMFVKIQDKGRSVLVYAPTEEVMELCEVLRPEGLAILLDNPPPAEELDSLYATFCKRYGGPS